MTFHNLQSVGDLMARATNDVREVNYMFSPGFNLVIGSLNFLFIPLIVGPSYNPALIVAPAIFIVLYVLALWHYLRILNPVTNTVRQNFGQLNSRLQKPLTGRNRQSPLRKMLKSIVSVIRDRQPECFRSSG